MPRRSWPALLLLVAFAAVLRARSTNAPVNGRITDSVKAVIAKANVAAINLGTKVRYGGRGFTNIFEKPRTIISHKSVLLIRNANFPSSIRSQAVIDVLPPCGKAVAY